MATKDTDNKTEETKTDKVTDLKDLGKAVEASQTDTKSADAKATVAAATATEETTEEAPVREPKKDEFGRAYGTGRRKNAVARVWVKPGKGKVTVNGKDQVDYFKRQTQRLVLNQPFLKVNRVGEFDVICTVKGGGLSGQAGAVRHGIARALCNFEPDLRGPLKAESMLTRDSRMVERKKIGLHKARRKKQWAKR